jgi:hypothetical protein
LPFSCQVDVAMTPLEERRNAQTSASEATAPSAATTSLPLDIAGGVNPFGAARKVAVPGTETLHRRSAKGTASRPGADSPADGSRRGSRGLDSARRTMSGRARPRCGRPYGLGTRSPSDPVWATPASLVTVSPAHWRLDGLGRAFLRTRRLPYAVTVRAGLR